MQSTFAKKEKIYALQQKNAKTTLVEHKAQVIALQSTIAEKDKIYALQQKNAKTTLEEHKAYVKALQSTFAEKDKEIQALQQNDTKTTLEEQKAWSKALHSTIAEKDREIYTLQKNENKILKSQLVLQQKLSTMKSDPKKKLSEADKNTILRAKQHCRKLALERKYNDGKVEKAREQVRRSTTNLLGEMTQHLLCR